MERARSRRQEPSSPKETPYDSCSLCPAAAFYFTARWSPSLPGSARSRPPPRPGRGNAGVNKQPPPSPPGLAPQERGAVKTSGTRGRRLAPALPPQPPPRLTGRAGGGEEQRPVPLEGRLQHAAARPHGRAAGVGEAEPAGRQQAAAAARRGALGLGLRPHGARRPQRGQEYRQYRQQRRHVAPRSRREAEAPPAAGGPPAKWQLGPAGPARTARGCRSLPSFCCEKPLHPDERCGASSRTAPPPSHPDPSSAPGFPGTALPAATQEPAPSDHPEPAARRSRADGDTARELGDKR